MALLKQQWRTERSSIISWALIMGGASWLLVYAFKFLLAGGLMRDLGEALKSAPPALQSLILGAGSFAFLNGIIESMLYGGFFLMIIAVYVGITVPGLISREMDQHNLEFLLALPVRRPVLVLVRWLSLVGGLAAISVLHWVGVVIGTGAEALPGRFLVAELNLFLVFTTIGTLIMLITIFIDDHSAAMGVSFGVAMGLLIINVALEGKTGWQAVLRKLSPYAWLKPDVAITGGQIPWGALAGLLLATGALLFLTVYAFNRKQIAA